MKLENPPKPMEGFGVAEIAQVLARQVFPEEDASFPIRRAAVAIILRASADSGLETLFIQRAIHPQDPWSGHMAFPGGHQDPDDPSPAAAARRETLEEVGLSLSEKMLIGRLPELSGGRLRQSGLTVSPFVFHAPETGALTLSSEVADAVWIPLNYLSDPANVKPYLYPPDPMRRKFSAFHYENYIIWGLTYRMIANFFDLFGVALPADGDLTDVE